MAEPGVAAVDLFDAQAGTPTLAQLQPYQIVVPYSNFPFFDPIRWVITWQTTWTEEA